MNPFADSATDHAQTAEPFVLVLGGANMDISGSTPQAMVLSDSNPGRIRCAPGGVARNVAENLARLGNATRLLTAVGDDLYGRSLLDVKRQRAQLEERNFGPNAILMVGHNTIRRAALIRRAAG